MKKIISFIFMMLAVLTLASCNKGSNDTQSGPKKLNINTSAEIKNMANKIDDVGDLSDVYQGRANQNSTSTTKLNSSVQLELGNVNLCSLNEVYDTEAVKLLADSKEESNGTSLEDITATKELYQDIIIDKNTILNNDIQYLNVWNESIPEGTVVQDKVRWDIFDHTAKPINPRYKTSEKTRITFDENSNKLYLEWLITSIPDHYRRNTDLYNDDLNYVIKPSDVTIPTPEESEYMKFLIEYTSDNKIHYEYIHAKFLTLYWAPGDTFKRYPNDLVACEKVEYLEDSFYEFIKYKNEGREGVINDDEQHKILLGELYNLPKNDIMYNTVVQKINMKNSDSVEYEVKRVDLSTENPILYYNKMKTHPIRIETEENSSTGTISKINYKTEYTSKYSCLYTIIDNKLVCYEKDQNYTYKDNTIKNLSIQIKDNLTNKYTPVINYTNSTLENDGNNIVISMRLSSLNGIKDIPVIDKDSVLNGTGVIEFDNGIILENVSENSEIYYYGYDDPDMYLTVSKENASSNIETLLNKYGVSHKEIGILDYYKYYTPTNIPGYNNDDFNTTRSEFTDLVASLKINFTELRKDYENVEEIKRPFNLNLEITYNDTSKLIQLDGTSVLKIEVKMEEIKSTNSDINFGDIPVLYLYIDGKMIEKQETSITEDGLVINFEEVFDEIKDGNMKIELRLASMGINIPISYVIVDGTATETQASNN